ncbi:MAG: hypothetical protein ACRDQ7_21295 [Haloechinothrix sp.]
MPSSSALPTPQEWPHDGRKYVAALIFLAGLGVLSVLVGFGFVAIGRPDGLKYGLLFAVLFFLTAAYPYVTRVRPGHRIGDIRVTEHDGTPATELRYSRAAFAILVGLMVCVIAILGLASVDFLLAGDEVPAGAVAVALAGAATLFCATFLLYVILGRLRRGTVVLSRTGIYQRGYAFSSFLPWSAIAGAKAAFNGTPEVLIIGYTNAPWEKRQHGGPWKLDKLPPVPMIELVCTAFAVSPVLIYHFVKFYVENPAARDELGTETSVQRARHGELS